MDYDNFYQVESFLVTRKEEKYVNELLKFGWKLISVIQYKDDYDAYGKYVLGADKNTFEKRNFQMILNEENEQDPLPL